MGEDRGCKGDLTSKELISQAMLTLMSSSSIEDIKVKDLLEEAKVSRSVFYYNFDSINGVVEYLINSFVDGLAQAMRAIVPDESRELRSHQYASNEMHEFVYRNRDLYSKLSRDSYVNPAFSSRLKKCLIEVYEDCDYFFEDKRSHRCMLAPREREYFIEMIVAQQMGAIDCWSSRGFAEDPKELGPMLMTLVNNMRNPEIERKRRYKDYGYVQFASWGDLEQLPVPTKVSK